MGSVTGGTLFRPLPLRNPTWVLGEGLRNPLVGSMCFVACGRFVFAEKQRRTAWIIWLAVVYVCIAACWWCCWELQADRSSSERRESFSLPRNGCFAMMIGYGYPAGGLYGHALSEGSFLGAGCLGGRVFGV